MMVSKLNPWNWFKKESEQEKTLPVKQTERGAREYASPLDHFHAEFDRMVDSMFSGFGMPSPRRLFDAASPMLGKSVIKPKVDIYGTDKEYVVEVDLPGIEDLNRAEEAFNEIYPLDLGHRFLLCGLVLGLFDFIIYLVFVGLFLQIVASL